MRIGEGKDRPDKIKGILFVFLCNEVKGQNLTPKELAYYLGVSTRTIYRYQRVIRQFKKDFNLPF